MNQQNDHVVELTSTEKAMLVGFRESVFSAMTHSEGGEIPSIERTKNILLVALADMYVRGKNESKPNQV